MRFASIKISDSLTETQGLLNPDPNLNILFPLDKGAGSKV